KTVLTDRWGDAGAISAKAIVSGDGFLQFSTAEADRAKIVGLGNGNSSQSYQDVEYGVYLTAAGGVQVYESGLRRGIFGKYAAGDRFRVGIDSGVVQYSRNGVVFYTSAVAPKYPLLAAAALYPRHATVTDAFMAGALPQAPPVADPGGPYFGWP